MINVEFFIFVIYVIKVNILMIFENDISYFEKFNIDIIKVLW